MTIAEFDHLNVEKKKELLQQCCGSSAWVNKMLTVFPVEDLVDLLECAEEKWYECSEKDWLQAFEQHPKIGDINSLKKKYANTAAWAADEQSGVNVAPGQTIEELSMLNNEYEKKFGFIFIVYATGKSANQMLQLLKERINNNPEEEIKIAAEEQNKITKNQVRKTISMSHITTHILDTTKGKPAQGVHITLYQQQNNQWIETAKGITNADGRINDLLKDDLVLPAGVYKLKFETKAYFDKYLVLSFYPFVEIVFEIRTKEHYHVPLLLNPFGYSTYRGS